jgi:tetratricopeptide (TPR) repeat protein
MGAAAFTMDEESVSEETMAARAKSAWESGAANSMLQSLDRWMHDHPHSQGLDKLHGDILATSRRLPEAVEAYDVGLAKKPAALEIRWAKWSVLTRSGRREEAVAELQRIAQVDVQNPLVYLRLAQEFRKLDRLEDSLEPYKKAVELAPEMLGWRLAMARTRFDILDYPGAYADVQAVLEAVPPGSPLEIPARNLLSVIIGDDSASERGRRMKIFPAADVPQEKRKAWALMRGEAWKLFAAGRYAEAEPLYRKLMALNPRDPTAAHQLGLILMESGRCKEALPFLQTVANLDPSDEEYADSMFRTGQCLAELEQWPEALGYFQLLYEAAVAAEKSAKEAGLPSGTRVLDKNTMARWLDKIRPHVPEAERIISPGPVAPAPELSEKELFAKIAAEPLKPQKALDTRTSLMGRDADFSWFRFVIPAAKVMRDDFPTGEHEFIPINPTDSFPPTQQEIYLVFALVSAADDGVPLIAQCFSETAEMSGEIRAVAQDRVILSMSDQSGYFRLSPPVAGWTPGLYRCGLFEGERTSAYTQVDEVRFRITGPQQSPRPS